MYNKIYKMTQEQLRMQMLAGIITEGQYKTTLNEGELLQAINPKPSGEFKDAVVALENYLATTGGTFDYNELAYLIIDIKDAGMSMANEY
jgi:hypothetical protein